MIKIKYISRIRIIQLLFLFIVFFGCEKEVDINLRKQGGIITCYSFVHPGNSLQINLTKSTSIVSVNDYDLIDNGRVAIFKNGDLYRNYDFPNDTINATWFNINFGYNDTIEFYIDEASSKRIYAYTVIPSLVEINDIDTSSIIINYNGVRDSLMHISINFTDLVDEVNYYQLTIEREVQRMGNGHNDSFSEIIEYPKSDGVFAETEKGVFSIEEIDFQGLFSDVSIEGGECKIEIELPKKIFELGNDEEEGNIIVKLHHVNEDYFSYLKSRIIYETNNGIPIFDPIKIYSNVEEGYGVVCGYSSDSDTIAIK